MKFLFAISLMLISLNNVKAQYTENGSAAITNCHCYVLTPDVLTKSGSVWNNNKIDLNQSFDYQFNVFLGCNDNTGADGIVFALQPISTSVGSVGGGMGFEGITPSIGITLDTWQNVDYNDPAYDHIDFQYNGNLTHIGVPPPISATSDNVEDCKWHTLRITWNAQSTTYTAYFDGQLRITANVDLVNAVFKGNSMVFWGFTGSTGGASNLQQFCTALNPIYNLLPTQKRCIGEPIQFKDSTISFAPLYKRYWNFGDGSPIDSVNTNPIHTYYVANDYTVLQTVIGIDGCSETNKQIIRIGSKPIVSFIMNDACADSIVSFKDASTEQVGTINEWSWDLGYGVNSSLQNPGQGYPMYDGATAIPIKLSVKTLEGCSSDTVTKYLSIFPRPIANFTGISEACLNTAVSFDDASYLPNSTNGLNSSINTWGWNFGNGQLSTTKNNTISFATSGDNTISLTVKTDKGCGSLPLLKMVHILTKPIPYFTTSIACQNATTTFADSSIASNGSSIKSWWWNIGNGGPAFSTQKVDNIYKNYGDITVQLLVTNNNNCASDTLKKVVTIGVKPIANFKAILPLCENAIISFVDSSVTAVGAVKNWLWLFDNGDRSTTKNSEIYFTKGNHTVKLIVENSAGCSSDTATKNLFTNAAPAPGFSFEATCKNAVANFFGSDLSGENISAWAWYFGDASISTSQNTQHKFGAIGEFPIKFTLASAAGCSAVKDSSILIYGTNVFAGNDTIAAPNQPIKLQASGGLNYKWSPALGLSSDTIANPIATNFRDQTYYLKASTPIGCDSYDTISIKIYAGPQLYLPTAFSPNGDGLNDVFKVFPVGMAQFELLSIYDRFGKIIFSSKNVTRGWDGTFKNDPQSAGTYIWTVSGTDYKGNKMMRKGTVVLVR